MRFFSFFWISFPRYGFSIPSSPIHFVTRAPPQKKREEKEIFLDFPFICKVVGISCITWKIVENFKPLKAQCNWPQHPFSEVWRETEERFLAKQKSFQKEVRQADFVIDRAYSALDTLIGWYLNPATDEPWQSSFRSLPSFMDNHLLD